MRRSTMLKGLVLVAAATLTVSACGSKTAGGTSSATSAAASATSEASSAASGSETGSASASESGAGSSAASSGGGSGQLSIQGVSQINADGAKVPTAAAGKAANPAGDGKATCSGVAVGMAGALTGEAAALGINILNGMKVALDVHNKANPNCQVKITQFDTEGDAQKATQVAPAIIADQSVIGLIGPAFSGETKAVGGKFFQAGLLSLTASATNPGLTQNGWTNFFRGLGNDTSQGGATANYLTKTLSYKKICVVQDNQDYSVGLAKVVTETLGDAADTTCAGKVKKGDKDFSAVVNQVKTAAPDAVYYAGYYPEAAPFVSQLRAAGVTATFVSGDGTNDPEFVKQAGEAAKGAILTCPCAPAPEAYATQYKALNGQAPGVYSVEGYDLMTIVLLGIDSGIKTRADMINWVKNYDGEGLGKTYKWDNTGELAVTTPWVYEVK